MTRTICLLVVSLALALPVAADQLVALGVLEQPQCKNEKKASVRLMFTKVGSGWVRLNDEYQVPKNLDLTRPEWTVAFDGRRLGSVRLRDPNPSAPTLKDWYYARDKLYEPQAVDKLPVVKNDSKSFAGWCGAPADWPLVLVSQPNFSDPEKWKPFRPNESYRQRLFVPAKLVVGRFNARQCRSGSETGEPWEFGPNDLVFYKSFRSAAGKEVVAIGIDPEKIGCDGPSLPEWSGNWFLLDGERIEFLGNQMELVDAGDYDKDGRSELLFWHSGYNRDGYVLVYDEFKRKVDYIWGYH